MPLKFDVGDRFPDWELTDDRGQKQTISGLADRQPLVLAFFRGPW
jgi:peroxiredoxin